MAVVCYVEKLLFNPSVGSVSQGKVSRNSVDNHTPPDEQGSGE